MKKFNLNIIAAKICGSFNIIVLLSLGIFFFKGLNYGIDFSEETYFKLNMISL